MPVVSPAEHDQVERELDLLIREARRRRRRRRLRLASFTVVLAIAGVVTGSVSGWLSLMRIEGRDAGRPAGASGAGCPVSPARFVANSQFDALVVGNGRVRLGIGNRYDARQREVVVSTGRRQRWGGIEAIWWMTAPVVPGRLTVRGVALAKQGPIEVKASNDGLGPGSGPLTLPSDFQPAPGASAYPAVYPGELFVRAGGCYALNISAQGFKERIVFDVLTQSE